MKVSLPQLRAPDLLSIGLEQRLDLLGVRGLDLLVRSSLVVRGKGGGRRGRRGQRRRRGHLDGGGAVREEGEASREGFPHELYQLQHAPVDAPLRAGEDAWRPRQQAWEGNEEIMRRS